MSLFSRIIKESTEDRTEHCKEDPVGCLKQVVLDGVVFIVMFSILSIVADRKVPDADSLVTFFSVWVPLLFVLKLMDLEYAQQFARVAGWLMAQKLFGIMATV